jgi:serine/threonine-protein kinase
MRLSVDLGPDAATSRRVTAVISPDGTRLVFPVHGAGVRQSFATRLLDQFKATLLSGTEDGTDAFFSPDGQWIGFFAGGKLKKVSAQGGVAVTLADVPTARGGSWGKDGNIIVGTTLSGLVRVSSAGGTPQPLTQLKSGEATHRWPQILPDGNAVLFTSSPIAAANEGASIEVLSLKTGERKTLWRGGYYGHYLPSNGSHGHLIFVHQGAVFVVPFDPARLELQGTPVPLQEDVAVSPNNGTAEIDFSQNGTLVYLSGNTGNAWPVVWLDSSGKTTPLISEPGTYLTPRFSPDGKWLALGVNTGGPGAVWRYDLQRDSMSRLSSAESLPYPVWTPDGKHIIFRSSGAINWIRSDGAGEVQELLKRSAQIIPFSLSPDGRRLAYTELSPNNATDLWTLPLDLSDPEHPKPGKPELFLGTQDNEQNPSFSPNGRWIAYYSNESGVNEVYVRPFPGPGGKWQISSGGGYRPIWSQNDHEVFYETLTLDHQIMVADYTAKGDSFMAGKPRVWSETPIYDPGATNFALAPDGKRFAVFPTSDSTGKKDNLHVTFLLNFADELRRIAPPSKK